MPGANVNKLISLLQLEEIVMPFKNTRFCTSHRVEVVDAGSQWVVGRAHTDDEWHSKRSPCRIKNDYRLDTLNEAMSTVKRYNYEPEVVGEADYREAQKVTRALLGQDTRDHWRNVADSLEPGDIWLLATRLRPCMGRPSSSSTTGRIK